MHIDDYANLMTSDLYHRFKRAVELGRWPDGRRLTPEQTQTCMEAIIAYEARHLPPEQRVGYIPPKDGDACEPHGQDDEIQPLNWQ